MSKPQYKVIKRTDFVRARYDRFLKKKLFLDEYGLKQSAVLTDLDKTYPSFKKPMKEVILCDRCNEDIEDPVILMLEDVLVYHVQCIKDSINSVEINDVIDSMIEPYENIVSIFKGKKEN